MFGAWSQVRQDERRDALIAFCSLFAFIAAHSLMETARDALFLSRLPVSRLPWVYLAAAAVAFVATRFSGRATSAGGPALALGVVMAAALTGALAVVAGGGAVWTLYAIYIWSAVMITLVVGHFYVLLGERFTVTQAKRIYAFIGAGSVAGAIAGNALGTVLAQALPAHALLATASVILSLGALGPMLMRRPAAHPAVLMETDSGMSIVDVWQAPYSRRLGMLMVVSTSTLTLVDYLFKMAVVDAVPAAELVVFFARFYLAISIASLVTQLWLVRPIIRALNTYGALLILPTLLALGTLGLAIAGGLIAALALKGSGDSLRHSLHATATELLYVPMETRLRTAAKTTIDMVGQRVGQGVASLAILGAIALSATPLHFCMAILAMCIVWFALALSMRREYVSLLRETLSQSALSDRRAFPELDMGSLESLIGALNSPDDGEVRTALQLLAERDRANLIPALILYHPSADVVEAALDILTRSGREDFLPTAQRLSSHEYAAVRAASLRAQIAIDPQEDILRERLEVTCPVVRATAVVGLAAMGYATQQETEESIDGIVADGSDIAKEALAKAIAYRPASRFEDVLIRLSQDPSRIVQRAATTAMTGCPSARFLPQLLRMLPVRETREHVRQVLVAMDETALDFLTGALIDTNTPEAVRRHLPRTIHRFAPERAARILTDQLRDEPDGIVRYKILRALGRLKTDNPDLELDKAILRKRADITLSAIFALIDQRVTLQRGAAELESRRTEAHILLSTLLGDKEQSAIERLFRLFGLLHPNADLISLYRGLRSKQPDVRSSSRELLEHVVPKRWRQAVVAMVDDGGDALRLASAGDFHKHEQLTYDALLQRLAQSESESLRSIASYHARELGLPATPIVRAEPETPNAGSLSLRVGLTGGAKESPT